MTTKSQLDEVVAAVKRGRGLGDVAMSYPAAELGDLERQLDIELPRVRAAIVDAHRELMSRAKEHVGLLAPVAVVLALERHRSRKTAITLVNARAKDIAERTHDLAMLMHRPKTHDAVLELTEALVDNPGDTGLGPHVYANLLMLLGGPKHSLRRPRVRVRELIAICRANAGDDPKVEANAAELESYL